MKMPSRMNRFKTEKTLWNRLTILGYILLGFSFLSLVYAVALLFHQNDEELYAEQNTSTEVLNNEEECLADETLNFFVISAIFVSVGVTCLVTVRKKQSENEEEEGNE